MTTKQSITVGVVVLLLVGLITIRSCMIKPTPFKPQHIVLIGIDTMRADEIKKLGPVHDWAERKATIYENVYTTSPWTFPAFASMLTGQWPSKVGATDYNIATVLDHEEPELSRLDPLATTLAEMMNSCGYRTVGLSNSIWVSKLTGLDRGFDSFRQIENERCAETILQAEYRAGQMEGEDYFMFIHLMDPHLPYQPLKPEALKTLGNYEGRFYTQAGTLRTPIGPYEDVTEKERTRMRQLYRGEINYVGRRLMKLIKYFVEQDAETLIIITSDHGEEFWDHGGFEHGHTMYDELLRVPLIVYDGKNGFWPNATTAVSLVDIFPSVLDWAGIETGHVEVLDGRSLWSTLIDWDRPIYHEGVLYGGAKEALTYQGHRMVLTYTGPEMGELELFSRITDKGMRTNLAGTGHPLEREMLNLLYNWKLECDSYAANGREFIEIGPEERAELESIGYLGGS